MTHPGTPQSRPASVTIAAMLMVLIGVLSAGVGGFLMWALFILEPGSDSNLLVQRGVGLAIGFTFLATGLLVIGLALGVLRRRNWARVITFILHGFFIFVGLIALLLFVSVLGEFNSSNTIKDTIGPAGGVIVLLAMALGLVVLALTVVLLAVPRAGRWFRQSA